MFKIQAQAIAKTIASGTQDETDLIRQHLERAYQRGREDKAAEVCAVIGATKTYQVEGE